MLRLNGLTGGLAGVAIVVAGFVASTIIAPPSPRQQIATPAVAPAQMPAEPSAEPPAPSDAVEDAAEDAAPLADDEPTAAEPSAEQPMDMAAPEQPTDEAPNPAPAMAAEDKPDPAAEAPLADMPPSRPQLADPERPDTPAAMADAAPPALPEPMLRPAPGGLPGAPVPPRDAPLPASPDAPQGQEDAASAPENGTTLPDPADSPAPSPEDTPSLPGTRVAGLPGTPATQPDPADAPEADTPTATALERNSSFDGTLSGGPLMAIILNDPGLPTPLRRALAALDLPVTIALNPMDPSASQGAEIYREAGKEVLILANGLPDGARASDLDVTFSAWFDSLPQAVGVLDLPRGGFARNAALTSGVLPLIARDGHGLVSFAGGLSRIGTAAEAEGVPHAEVFRVLDDEDQSPFTIRRYLDRAVFQASQIGEVLVFGDAANDATMEALELWRSDGRADQVAVVPVSAILLTR
ncbi:divergent polysaccharide deacetylase family protein [Roseibaca sp. Y0-43]|uniref:divergent polysaccharide deacetylase family protein n=1 Tax=Roseibaca sp. Y0-43 TaxID=2816854 RepID=UPI001D0C4BFB|nr:divergent polysaccharide deacetylase family protein [Roseibaca sp. Y0-43]MCC1481843.1 divergent polysaccharide deacetylase family protein [Roseibaca sp. Y0-43]